MAPNDVGSRVCSLGRVALRGRWSLNLQARLRPTVVSAARRAPRVASRGRLDTWPGATGPRLVIAPMLSPALPPPPPADSELRLSPQGLNPVRTPKLSSSPPRESSLLVSTAPIASWRSQMLPHEP